MRPGPPVDRRGVFAWMLFDWANQPFQTLIATFVFAPYFVAEVVGDPVRGQALWGAAAAIGGAIVALLAPLLGALADLTGARKRWILACSVPFVLGCSAFWLAVPGMAHPEVILVVYAVAFIGSEFGQVFINAMLPGLGPRDEIGRISGSGWALGYLGGLVSLILVLLLLAPAPGATTTLLGIAPILGLDPAAGEPARATGPLSALWYVVFAVPLFLFTPDEPPRRAPGAVRAGLRDLAATFRLAARHRSFFAFLIASMIYRDALVALFTFGGIYAAGVLGWGLFQLGVFGIVAAGVGAIGAWVGGRADRAFGPRPVIVAAIWALIAVSAVTLLTTRTSVLGFAVSPGSRLPDVVFMVAGGLLGAAAGALQAASRTLLIHQAEGRVAPAQAFGLFALSGRATAFIGPGLIAAVTAATGSQRLGVSPVIVLFLVGLGLLYWVKTDNEQPQETLRMMRPTLVAMFAACLALAALAAPAAAQTARQLFAAKSTPSPHDPYSVGQASRGCLAGGVRLPESGPTWQAMRLSRNHHWGNPLMIGFIEDLSRTAVKAGWRGLYVGDIGQARGGPVPGHASHQTGLDADVWVTPPPRLDLTRSERERISAISVLASDKRHVNANWTPSHAAILEAAARDPRVNRIFITAPVKLEMCAAAGRGDSAWLRKIRPWWNHDDHFHIRLNCPRGATGCVDQDALPPGDGCEGAVWWVTDALLPPDPNAPKVPPKPPLRLADLPPQCAEVLKAR